jgi:hypothetical protein
MMSKRIPLATAVVNDYRSTIPCNSVRAQVWKNARGQLQNVRSSSLDSTNLCKNISGAESTLLHGTPKSKKSYRSSKYSYLHCMYLSPLS